MDICVLTNSDCHSRCPPPDLNLTRPRQVVERCIHTEYLIHHRLPPPVSTPSVPKNGDISYLIPPTIEGSKQADRHEYACEYADRSRSTRADRRARRLTDDESHALPT